MASDPDGALRRVNAVGFASVAVAPPPPGLSPEHLAKCLVRHDLAVVSIHGALPTPGDVALSVRIADKCRCPKIIWHGWPRDPLCDTPEELRGLVATCNEAGVIARDHGLRLGMHNSWWEFEPVEGMPPFRLLHGSLHPAISWQMDIYWARTPGAEPADVLRDLGAKGRLAPLEGWTGRP